MSLENYLNFMEITENYIDSINSDMKKKNNIYLGSGRVLTPQCIIVLASCKYLT